MGRPHKDEYVGVHQSDKRGSDETSFNLDYHINETVQCTLKSTGLCANFHRDAGCAGCYACRPPAS
jgi:hypothetical protein